MPAYNPTECHKLTKTVGNRASLDSRGDGLPLGRADAFDRLRVVGRVEHRGARHDRVAAGLDDLPRVRGANAAVDLDPRVDALRDAHRLQLLDLLDLRLDEALAAEAWVHGHDQDEVDLLQHVLDGGQRGARVQHYASGAAGLLDLADGAVEMDRRRSLAMHRDDVRAGLGEVLNALLGFDDHQVAVQQRVGVFLAQGVHDQRPDGDVGYEATVHDVHVHPVGTSLQRVPDLVAQPREVRRPH